MFKMKENQSLIKTNKQTNKNSDYILCKKIFCVLNFQSFVLFPRKIQSSIIQPIRRLFAIIVALIRIKGLYFKETKYLGWELSKTCLYPKRWYFVYNWTTFSSNPRYLGSALLFLWNTKVFSPLMCFSPII